MNFNVPEGLTDLLQNFTIAVLRERPRDLVDFAATYFQNLRECRVRKYNDEEEDDEFGKHNTKQSITRKLVALSISYNTVIDTHYHYHCSACVHCFHFPWMFNQSEFAARDSGSSICFIYLCQGYILLDICLVSIYGVCNVGQASLDDGDVVGYLSSDPQHILQTTYHYSWLISVWDEHNQVSQPYNIVDCRALVRTFAFTLKGAELIFRRRDVNLNSWKNRVRILMSLAICFCSVSTANRTAEISLHEKVEVLQFASTWNVANFFFLKVHICKF